MSTIAIDLVPVEQSPSRIGDVAANKMKLVVDLDSIDSIEVYYQGDMRKITAEQYWLALNKSLEAE